MTISRQHIEAFVASALVAVVASMVIGGIVTAVLSRTMDKYKITDKSNNLTYIVTNITTTDKTITATDAATGARVIIVVTSAVEIKPIP